MKKYFLFSVMILTTLCVGFSSCSKDDDEGGSTDGNVIGKWKLVNRTMNGEKYPFSKNDYLEIKSDGTFLEYDEGDYGVGVWSQANGKLTKNYDDELLEKMKLNPNTTVIHYPNPLTYTISKLDDKNMVLKATILGYEDIMTYEK